MTMFLSYLICWSLNTGARDQPLGFPDSPSDVFERLSNQHAYPYYYPPVLVALKLILRT